jgi:hypothetical protein
MDKLQWFKFTPTDWIMGKIQRCPEITQARFMRLICLYWNKECLLSYEDAEIEIDKEHLDILLLKKIIKIENDFLIIDFLNEQMENISETSQKRREAVLKRWEKVKQINTSVSEINTSVLQNDTEKSREEKEKEKEKEENNVVFAEVLEFSFDEFWGLYPNKTNKKGAKVRFDKLTKSQKEKIEQHLPYFISNKPFKEYNYPHATTYLNQERYNDEVINNNQTLKTHNNGITELTAEIRFNNPGI